MSYSSKSCNLVGCSSDLSSRRQNQKCILCCGRNKKEEQEHYCFGLNGFFSTHDRTAIDLSCFALLRTNVLA